MKIEIMYLAYECYHIKLTTLIDNVYLLDGFCYGIFEVRNSFIIKGNFNGISMNKLIVINMKKPKKY